VTAATPGQAAYEGYCGSDSFPIWDDAMDPWLRRKWERAALRGHEAIAAQEPHAAPGESSPLGLKHAVTSNRLGHALAALREIAGRAEGSGQGLAIAAHGIARNALDDDAAMRDNVALTREPQPAPELAAAIDPAKLDLLADWFDVDDLAKGRSGRTEVQADLRRWATLVRKAREA
jgi:hypothetical protein